jgi:hypothetical protein
VLRSLPGTEAERKTKTKQHSRFYSTFEFNTSPAGAQVGFIDGINGALRDFLEALVDGPNSAPTVSGTVAGQPVTDLTTARPFSQTTISDIDTPPQALLVRVKMDDPAKGSFTGLNGFTDQGDGIVEFTGTAEAAAGAIQGLVFDPADARVPLGQTETTGFTIFVNDNTASWVVENYTSVISTSVVGISHIPNQVITMGTSPAAIAFFVSGFDTSSVNFSITGSSSNPALVSNENIAFDGAGTNRTVAVIPKANKTGVATITISVSDGTRAAKVSFPFAVAQVPLSSCVIPSGLANVDDGASSASLVVAGRSQEVYDASHFPNGIIAIKELRFRRALGQTPFTATIPNLQISLSTTPRIPEKWDGDLAMEATFANNVGPDETVVYSGALPIASLGTGPPGAPNPFDIVVPLTTAFIYNSTAGNLLVDVRNFSGSSAGLVSASNDSNDAASRLFVSNTAVDPNACCSDSTVEIIQLSYAQVGTPPVLSTDFASASIVQDTLTTLNITVSDAETSPDSLNVMATSSNPNLLPNANLTIGGSEPVDN